MKGTYTKIDFENDINNSNSSNNWLNSNNKIKKIISPETGLEKDVLNILLNEEDLKIKVTKYINRLKKLKINIPKVYDISNDYYVCDYINGLTIEEYIEKIIEKTYNDDYDYIEEVIDVFSKLMDILKLEVSQDQDIDKTIDNDKDDDKKGKDKKDSRNMSSYVIVDYNLRNFIVCNNQLVLVDIIPPLFKDDVLRLKDTKYEMLSYVYLNSYVKISGIIGYFIKSIFNAIVLTNNNELDINDIKNDIKKIILRMKEVLKDKEIDYDFYEYEKEDINAISHVFIERIKLLNEFIEDNNKYKNIKDIKNFINRYNNMSLNKILIKCSEDEMDNKLEMYNYDFCMQDIKVKVSSNIKEIIDNNIHIYDNYLSNENNDSYDEIFSYHIDFITDKIAYDNINGLDYSMFENDDIFYLVDKEEGDLIDNKVIINKIERSIKVYFRDFNDKKLLFAKRIISNVICKLFEEAGYILFHCSCIANDNEGVIITGKKGSGKTTTMLKFLEAGYKFVTNDKIALKIKDNKLVACGFPLSIGVIRNNDVTNKNLKEYLDKKNDIPDTIRKGDKIFIKTVDFVSLLNTSIKRKTFVNRVIVPVYEKEREEIEVRNIPFECFIDFAKLMLLDAVSEEKMYLDSIIKKDEIDEIDGIDSLDKEEKNSGIQEVLFELFKNVELLDVKQGQKTNKEFFEKIINK